MKRILVVGSGSLIGAAISNNYARIGVQVVGSRRAFWSKQNSPKGEEGLLIDLQKPETFENLAGEFDAVFMCAAITSIAQCEEFPEETSLVNVTNTLRLLHRLSQVSPRIVFISSSAVFGPDSLGYSEDCATGNPRYEYGRQKAAVEKALLSNCDGTAVVRISKVLSRTMPLMQKFSSALAAQLECRPFTNLFISPVSLRYVVDSLVRVAESEHGGVFHLSGEEVISYADFLHSFALHNGYLTDKIVEAKMGYDAIPSPLDSKVYALLGMERTTALLNIFPQSLARVLADI